MSNKTIADLRDILFDTIKSLDESKGPEALERARMKCDLAQTIINSAKVEVDFAKAVGHTKASQFIPLVEKAAAPEPAFPPGIVGIRRHTIEG